MTYRPTCKFNGSEQVAQTLYILMRQAYIF